MNNTHLWRAFGRNFITSILLFGAFLGLLWLVEILFPSMQGQLLHFDNTAWVVGIPASIIGVAYILTVRDPQNFTGFFAGIVMSALLGVQFTLLRQYDSTFLYFFVFIPFQMMSIYKWSRKKEDGGASFEPKFLDIPRFWLSVGLCIAITLGDYFIQTFVFNGNGDLTENVAAKLCSGLMISSSFLANYWLIYRKTDSWVYWFIYSVSGIVFFSLPGATHNPFSIVLFIFFLVINSMAGIAWIRDTKPEDFGWATCIFARKK